MVYSHWTEPGHGLGPSGLLDNVLKFSNYTGTGKGAGTYYPQLTIHCYCYYYYVDIIHADKH